MTRACRHDGHMVRTEEVLQANLFLFQPMDLAKHADVVLLKQAALKKARLSCGSRPTARSTWPDSMASFRLVAVLRTVLMVTEGATSSMRCISGGRK